MEEMRNLEDLLKHELEDLYSAEQQIIEALPGMIENASNAQLKKSLQQHLKITKQQKDRLDKIKTILGQESQDNGKEGGFFSKLFSGGEEGSSHCKAMEGLIKEGEKLMAEDATPEVCDAAIIAAAQKIEHYEISAYGTARAYALHLGMQDVAKILTQTLNEEYEADTVLNELAMGKVNLEADEGLQSLRKLPSADASSTGRSSGRKAPAQRSTRTRSNSGSTTPSKSPNSPRGGKSGGRTRSKGQSTSRASNSRKNSSGRGSSGRGRK